MFDGAKKVAVNGGMFVVSAGGSPSSTSGGKHSRGHTLTTSTEVNLDSIFSNVSRNAILNADGRADEVRCYPGTREGVVGKVENWMNGEGTRMMWLSGPAGAGKSAICQTLAERCRERGQHEANFFFFRGDSTRNRAQPLVTTLVYQLRRLHPALDVPLGYCLMEDPLICSASVEEQFIQLISSPIQSLRQYSPIGQPIVLIIDGLDECDDKGKQEQILVALRALANADESPFLVLVSSRAEPQIVRSFNRIGRSAESIFLNDEYDDIRRFVVAKFLEIMTEHSLACTLSGDWPLPADVNAIIEKSSGQFIYAATVMRFIERSHDNPALSLRKIIEMQPITGHSPYAQLDALYSYIFSQCREIQTLILILGAHFVSSNFNNGFFGDLLDLVGHAAIAIESLFADLTAIIQVTLGPRIKLAFYHASLSDYLRDESRSGPYYVNKVEIATVLGTTCLENFHNSDTLYITAYVLGQVEEATEALSKSLLNSSARKLNNTIGYHDDWDYFGHAIGELYLKKDKHMLKIMLRHWVRFGYRNGLTSLISVSSRDLPPSALKYYKRCLTIERLKLALGLSE